LDDFVVTRKWTSNETSYLKVTNREGLQFSSPQELLNNFIGKLSFDPSKFALMNDKEQKDLLIEVVNVDIEKYDTMLVQLREDRRLAGQTVKLYEGQREQGDFSGIPNKEIDTKALYADLEGRVEHNNNRTSEEESSRYLQDQIANDERTVKELEEDLAQYKTRIKSNKLTLNKKSAWLKKTAVMDVDELREKINKATEVNKCVRAKLRNVETDEKWRKAKKIYDNYTNRIDQVLFDKAKELKEAKMPIKGLSVSDTGVEYFDIPFRQLSSSEQIRVSLSIAMALNPDLKVIRITNGSLLDEASKAVVEEMADKFDFQIWIEVIDGTGEIGFYISEGEVANES